MVDPKEALFRPVRAFAADEEPSLFPPFLVVIVYGAVALASVAPVLAGISDLLPESWAIAVAVGDEQVSAPGIPVAIMALGVVLVLLLWMLSSAVAYGGARLLDGTGDLAETVAFVGWGFLPKLLGSLVLTAIVLVVAVLTPEATFFELLVGSRAELESTGLSVTGPGGVLLPVVLAVEVIGTVWSTYVWYGGLSGEHALGRRRALAIAAVLFLLFNGI